MTDRQIMTTIMLLVLAVVASAMLTGCTGKRFANDGDPWCQLSRTMCK